MAGEESDTATYTVKVTITVTITDELVSDRQIVPVKKKKEEEVTTVRHDVAPGVSSYVQVASSGSNRNITGRKRKIFCDSEESEASVESDDVAAAEESMNVDGYDMPAGDSSSVKFAGRIMEICRRNKRGRTNNAEIENEEESDEDDDVADGGMERETEKEALRNTGTFIQRFVPKFKRRKRKVTSQEGEHVVPKFNKRNPKVPSHDIFTHLYFNL